MAKISVVIPCYNVEQYIDRCMESIVNQTIGIENLEVIVVNDASTDQTLDKLKSWEQKFPNNILVITYEENIRQGGARNVGMKYASSKYLGFVDADDWIEPDMYASLYEKMISGTYDVVQGKFIREHFKGEKEITSKNREDVEYHFEPRKKNGIYCGKIEKTGTIGEYGSICTGLYQLDFIKEKKLYFPENLAYEDNYWGGIFELYLKDIYIVDKVFYHYFINPASTVTEKNRTHQFDRLKIEVMLVEELKKQGAFEFSYREIEKNFLQRYYLYTGVIIFTRFDYIPNIYQSMKETILKFFPTYYDNPYLDTINAREKQLMKMLQMNHIFTVEELEKIKIVYLKSFGK